MKYMNMKKKYLPLNLQFFSEGGEGDNGDDSGEGDDLDDDDADEDGEDPDEKKFSQKDVNEAVKKRVAREKRKWQQKQQKSKEEPDGKGKAGEESEDSKARKMAEAKASSLEVKVACYEAGVAKDAVTDVAALAKAYMEAGEDLDLEDAIEKVVKKYPQFKKNSADPYDEEEKENKKAWGQRQSGKASKKMSGVEAKFYELNPDLKP